MTSSRPRRLAVLAAVIIIGVSALTACSASGESTPTVKVLEGIVSVVDSSGHSTRAHGTVPISDGESVTVDKAASIAQLTWPDGSYARVAGDSKFTVSGSGGVGTLSRGMIWIRASKASGLVIHTRSGKVSARASSLSILNCGNGCTVSDLSGSVQVGKQALKPLTVAAVTLAKPSIKPLPWDSVFGDAFAVKNASLDAKAGFAKATAVYANASPTLASLSGTFSGTRTITRSTCTGPGATCAALVTGNVAARTYTFAIDCSKGIPCTGQAVTDIALISGKPDTHPKVDLSFNGTDFAWGSQTTGPYCKVGSQDTGTQANKLSWTVHATAAAVVNGAFVVTKLAGTATASDVITKKAPNPGCAAIMTVFATSADLDVTRQ